MSFVARGGTSLPTSRCRSRSSRSRTPRLWATYRKARWTRRCSSWCAWCPISKSRWTYSSTSRTTGRNVLATRRSHSWQNSATTSDISTKSTISMNCGVGPTKAEKTKAGEIASISSTARNTMQTSKRSMLILGSWRGMHNFWASCSWCMGKQKSWWPMSSCRRCWSASKFTISSCTWSTRP